MEDKDEQRRKAAAKALPNQSLASSRVPLAFNPKQTAKLGTQYNPIF